MNGDAHASGGIPTGEAFERFAEGFPDAIHCVDPGGHLIYANRRAGELLGYAADALIRMTIDELYPPEIRDCFRAGFKQPAKADAQWARESLIRSKQGDRIPIELRAFPVCDDQGQVTHSVTIIRDLTPAVDSKNDLLHAQRLAAIGELSSCIAHDISNPLSVIKLYAEWLDTELGEDPGSVDPALFTTLSDGLENIQKAADRIELLINSLRAFSRTAEKEPSTVDLREVLDRSMIAMQSRIKNGGIAVETKLPDQVCHVAGHAEQLEQVLNNLIKNACDAVLVDGATTEPRLVVGIKRVDDPATSDNARLAITISDNGVGMTADVQENIYEPFFTTKAAEHGAGLGMTIVRNILRRHAGEISITSEPGRGATVSVRLPALSE